MAAREAGTALSGLRTTVEQTSVDTSPPRNRCLPRADSLPSSVDSTGSFLIPLRLRGGGAAQARLCGTTSPPPRLSPILPERRPDSPYTGSLVYADIDVERSSAQSNVLNLDWTFPDGEVTEPYAREPSPVSPMNIPKDTKHTPAEAAEIAELRRQRQASDLDSGRRHTSTGSYGAMSMTRALARRSSTTFDSSIDLQTALGHGPSNGNHAAFHIASHTPSPVSPPPLQPFPMSSEAGPSRPRGRDPTPVSHSSATYFSHRRTQYRSTTLLPPVAPPVEYPDPFGLSPSPSPTGQSPTPSLMYGPPLQMSPPELLLPPWAGPLQPRAQLQPPAQIDEPGPSHARSTREHDVTDPFVRSSSPSSSEESVDGNHEPDSPPQVHPPTLAMLTGDRLSPLLGYQPDFDPVELQGAGERMLGDRAFALQSPDRHGHNEETYDIDEEVYDRDEEIHDHDGDLDDDVAEYSEYNRMEGRTAVGFLTPLEGLVPQTLSAPDQPGLHHADTGESVDGVSRPVSYDLDAMIAELCDPRRLSALPTPLIEQTGLENPAWDADSASTRSQAGESQTGVDAVTPAMPHTDDFATSVLVSDTTDPSTLLSPDSVDADSPFPHTPGPTIPALDSAAKRGKWKQHSSQFGGPLGEHGRAEGDGEQGQHEPAPAQ